MLDIRFEVRNGRVHNVIYTVPSGTPDGEYSSASTATTEEPGNYADDLKE